jgi:hypothetical protein
MPSMRYHRGQCHCRQRRQLEPIIAPRRARICAGRMGCWASTCRMGGPLDRHFRRHDLLTTCPCLCAAIWELAAAKCRNTAVTMHLITLTWQLVDRMGAFLTADGDRCSIAFLLKLCDSSQSANVFSQEWLSVFEQ